MAENLANLPTNTPAPAAAAATSDSDKKSNTKKPKPFTGKASTPPITSLQLINPNLFSELPLSEHAVADLTLNEDVYMMEIDPVESNPPSIQSKKDNWTENTVPQEIPDENPDLAMSTLENPSLTRRLK
ncbi:hypothetical protein VKT23_014642 [Stygiomarasmius scandens]|uniref:Uncharacterized protein n=1 Tax=Marasmiellus scandens TaxID=2682957 RepID=A0ABR1J372_9AGAR